jgi:hypothetical protein
VLVAEHGAADGQPLVEEGAVVGHGGLVPLRSTGVTLSTVGSEGIIAGHRSGGRAPLAGVQLPLLRFRGHEARLASQLRAPPQVAAPRQLGPAPFVAARLVRF